MSRLARVLVVVTGLLLAGMVRVACAAEEYALEVAQPIWTENYIGVSRVTQIVWVGGPAPGLAVSWTAKPDLVLREGDPAPKNRNAAVMYGIDVRVIPWSSRSKRDFLWNDTLDTLDVVLDLSKLKPDASDLPDSLVVEATVECILTNAANDHPVPRFVNLTVQGDRRYGHFQRVYRLSDLGPLPRRRIFD